MTLDALTIAPCIIAVVLVLSAVGKLRSYEASAQAFHDLRVPAPLGNSLVVRALPWGELALGVLIVIAGGWLGVAVSVATLLLFTAYLVLVVRALGFEKPVDCACFGDFAPGQITRRTVVRNVWLLLLASVSLVLSLGSNSPLSRLSSEKANLAWLVATAAAAATAYLVVARGRASEQQSSTPLAQLDTDDDYLRTRTPALPVTLGDGTETDLRALSAERAQLLVFVSEGCGSCRDVIAAVPGWRDEMPVLDVRFVMALEPGASGITSTMEPLTVHDPAYRLPNSFGFRGTPSALLLGADGFVAGGPVTGSTAVPEFVAEVRHELTAALS